jgi:glucose-1-phosphate adenylyltransferase
MSKERIGRQSLAIILAGGHGSRLGALTRGRCKPALAFGGRYRSVDFTLSNCVNSGLTRIGVATQYHAQPLIQHIQQSWNFLSRERGECIELWAAEQREEARWYAGTADAVYQNLAALDRHKPRYVVVLAADHIYRMDYSTLLGFHEDRHADVTIACQPVPVEQARHFGIMSVDRDEIIDFQEKPVGASADRYVLASMGVYVFNADLLRTLLREDAARKDSTHDFGRDLIPACVAVPGIRTCAHRFRDPCTGAPGYWRDIGTVDTYWAANMDLLAREPGLDLCDPDWRIWAPPDRSAPTRMLQQSHELPTRISQAIVAGGCRLEGATVQRSVISSDVHVGAGSVVEDSILLPGARVGADCLIRRTIVDEGTVLPNGTCVGEHAMPAAPHCELSAGGVTVMSPHADARFIAGEPLRRDRRRNGTRKPAERPEPLAQPHREAPVAPRVLQ